MSYTWSPTQYLKFEDHRTRPAVDLLGRVNLSRADHITDIGCGPRNSTQLLVERFASALVTGLVTSPQMIKAASERLPACNFEKIAVSHWRPNSKQDVLFANAVLQWAPSHQKLLPKMVSFLEPGGVLAERADTCGHAHRCIRRPLVGCSQGRRR
ncbi:methyltransferase domain-containing protein [Rhizobium pusense]|uniref:methyltransferase domain-containing protein n=1 Tax=Agrobacterium pusense TaxID=648995 RepID=UPI001FDDCA98|nr:methyltransferase domain-containing protein [Agrobacterium pusense]